MPRFASRPISGYRCLSFHLKLLFRFGLNGGVAVCISSSLVAVSFPFLISVSPRLLLLYSRLFRSSVVSVSF